MGVGRLVSIKNWWFSGSNCLFTRGYIVYIRISLLTTPPQKKEAWKMTPVRSFNLVAIFSGVPCSPTGCKSWAKWTILCLVDIPKYVNRSDVLLFQYLDSFLFVVNSKLRHSSSAYFLVNIQILVVKSSYSPRCFKIVNSLNVKQRCFFQQVITSWIFLQISCSQSQPLFVVRSTQQACEKTPDKARHSPIMGWRKPVDCWLAIFHQPLSPNMFPLSIFNSHWNNCPTPDWKAVVFLGGGYSSNS